MRLPVARMFGVVRALCYGVLICAMFLLAGCGASGPLLPEQTGRPGGARPQPAPESYRVVSGDTLYSIAFRYGLDWRRVAEWNEIGAPYRILVGQWIRLQPPPDMRPAVASARTESASGARRAARSEPKTDPEPPDPVEAIATPNPAPHSKSEATPGPKPEIKAESGPEPARASPIPAASSRSVAGVAWRWPAEGSLVRGFSNGDTRKGMLIGGRAGQPVRAAADGEVVYSGNGLIGYGELIIVKHSERMLSAYGHNRERLVVEGARVRAGQQIARMGRDERDREVLHFEIRRDGQPVDPAAYLPQL